MNKKEIYHQILDLIDNLRNYPLSSNEEKTLEQFESQIALILYRSDRMGGFNTNNVNNYNENNAKTEENNKVSLARLYNLAPTNINAKTDNINMQTNADIKNDANNLHIGANIINNGGEHYNNENRYNESRQIEINEQPDQDDDKDNTSEIYGLIKSINGDAPNMIRETNKNNVDINDDNDNEEENDIDNIIRDGMNNIINGTSDYNNDDSYYGNSGISINDNNNMNDANDNNNDDSNIYNDENNHVYDAISVGSIARETLIDNSIENPENTENILKTELKTEEFDVDSEETTLISNTLEANDDIEEAEYYEDDENEEDENGGLFGFFKKNKNTEISKNNTSLIQKINTPKTQENQGFEGAESESDLTAKNDENELQNDSSNNLYSDDNDVLDSSNTDSYDVIDNDDEDINYKVSRIENDYHDGDPEPTDVHDVSNTPLIILSENAEIFNEEFEKDVDDFVYQRSHIKVGKDGKDDMMITIFPFDPRKDERNTKILVIAEYDNEYYIASSFENEDEGQNMVKMGIENYELLFQGGMENSKFVARIFPIGTTELVEVDKVINNPPRPQIGNGHIKFSYDASADVQGTIEIFAIKTMMNKNDLILVRRVQDFVDYAFPSESPFVVQTVQGNKVVNAANDRGRVKATLTDFSY